MEAGRRNRSWAILGALGVVVGLGLMTFKTSEEQQALAMMGNQLMAARDQAAPCLIAVERSPTPDRFAAAVRGCIEARHKGSYALQIELELPKEGPRLKALAGAEPSLSPAVVQACVDTLIVDFKPSPLGQTEWPGTMHEVYTVEMARDGAGVTRAWKRSGCGFPHALPVDRRPMRPVDLPGPALLACDAHASSKLNSARPLVFGLEIRHAASADDAGQCEPIGNWLPRAYSSCVCKALLDTHRAALATQAQGTVSLQVKTPEGRTVVVAQSNTPSVPELSRRWFLWRSEATEEPYLRMLTMADADIPIVWPEP